MENTHAASPLPSLAEIVKANPGWLDEGVDEHETARITTHSVTTLRSLRTRGGGPPYSKLGSKVVYIRRDIFAWLARGRRKSTADYGEPRKQLLLQEKAAMVCRPRRSGVEFPNTPK